MTELRLLAGNNYASDNVQVCSHALYTVYCHTNVVTQKKYIGLTKKSVERRWQEHVALAYDKRARSKYRRFCFQDAIKKHGVDSFEHLVLQSNILTLEEACQAERFWIAKLGTQYPNGYNCTAGGGGIVMTEECKLRHRAATVEALSNPEVRQRYLEGIRRGHSTQEFIVNNRKAQKLAQNRPDVAAKKSKKMKDLCSQTNYNSPCAKRVAQLDKSGDILAVYASATEAHKITGVNYSKITEVARGYRSRSGGFGWRYTND
jgi:group I intron endonuclease